MDQQMKKESNRHFQYNNKWNNLGDVIIYNNQEWVIKFIGVDACAIISRKNKIKTIIGSVRVRL